MIHLRKVTGRAAAVLLAIAAAGCSTPSALKDFTTDGCSLFPDGELRGDRKLWCDCCLRHDMTYWRGGTQDERLAADRTLRDCVRAKSGDRKLAALMYRGVRLGGHPAFPTWYRWGYGWAYGRGYEPLTAAEQQEAQQRMDRYLREHGTRYCDAPASPSSKK